MDPATAVGVASGILTFISTAEKTLRLAYTLHDSVDGSSEESKIRLKVADSINESSKWFIDANEASLPIEEKALSSLAQQCNQLATDIKEELHGLEPKRRGSKIDSGLAALRSLRAEPRIQDLEKRLQRCRDGLHFHLAALSRRSLQQLLTASREGGVKLTGIESSINQLRQSIQDMVSFEAEPISDQALNQMMHQLHLGQESLNEIVQDRILRGVKAKFDDMHYRYQNIDSPISGTFEWIFGLEGTSEEATRFNHWLSTGSDIFHICGKLGSGKSTLMKQLFGHARTRSKLEQWANADGGRRLVMAHFFFHHRGSNPLQKSLQGLRTALLYQIMVASPVLIAKLFPDQWVRAFSQPRLHSASEILDDDIKSAYERLSNQHDSDSFDGFCFCFFIDGLDEYQATTSSDRRDMVRSLQDLANGASGSFKICVSSRIENPFMEAFSEHSRLYLHNLTKSDIGKYVQNKLQHIDSDERQELVSSIIRKAEGVFLWVVLVVQKVREGSDNGSRLPRLLREINTLPSQLDDLFQHILDTLVAEDLWVLKYTVSLLHFLDATPSAKKLHLWLCLTDFYFLEDYIDDHHFAESTDFPWQNTETFEAIETRARRRLNGVCKGLVALDRVNDLDFTHRSVHAFFMQEKFQTRMSGHSFNNMEVLSQLKLASIRKWWMDRRCLENSLDDKERQEEASTLSRHSILVACLVRQRQEQQLDASPWKFLECIDTIPQLSATRTVGRALDHGKTAFRVTIAGKPEKNPPYEEYEICHSSNVRHNLPDDLAACVSHLGAGQGDIEMETSKVVCREADEIVDEIEEYTMAVISPLFTELCSGRTSYPLRRIAHAHDEPLEPDQVAMLVYCTVGVGIGRIFWKQRSGEPRVDEGIFGYLREVEDTNDYQALLKAAGILFLDVIFANQVACPNTPTHLAFGGEFGMVRIAAGIQRPSIWQHFFCWWLVVAAASGEFELNEAMRSHAETTDNFKQIEAGLILKVFLKNGAKTQLMTKVSYRGYVPTSEDDIWVAYVVEMLPNEGEPLKLSVVVNLHSRMWLDGYPYGSPKSWFDELHGGGNEAQSLPASHLSVRDWFSRSRLPNKTALLQLIDEKLDDGGRLFSRD